MSRHGKLRLTNRRALALGLGVSVAAHVAVLAFAGMDVPGLDQRKLSTITFEEAPAADEQAMEVVKLIPREGSAMILEPASAGGGTGDPGAAASSAPVPSVSSGIQQAVASAEITYDQLVVVDPVHSAAVTPIAFDELTVAETAAPATPEDEVAVYVPGSIGRAKRGWAAAGDADGSGAGGLRSGWSLVDGRGDGHCPMPGRGLPPTILR